MATAFALAGGVSTPASAGAGDVISCKKGKPSYRAAIAACGRLLRSGRYNRRNMAMIYRLVARHHYRLGYRRRAFIFMETAIQNEPGNYAHYKARAVLHLEHKDYRRALVDLNTALRINPKAAWTYAVRARVHRSIGHTAAAIRDLRMAARYDPDEREDYYRDIRKLGGTP